MRFWGWSDIVPIWVNRQEEKEKISWLLSILGLLKAESEATILVQNIYSQTE